jgi:hypothetical protein
LLLASLEYTHISSFHYWLFFLIFSHFLCFFPFSPVFSVSAFPFVSTCMYSFSFAFICVFLFCPLFRIVYVLHCMC